VEKKLQGKKDGTYDPFSSDTPGSQPDGYTQIGPRFRKTPAGSYETLGDGKWSEMSGRESAEMATALASVDNLKRLGLIGIDDGLRIGGAVAGAVGGGMAGGPPGAIVGAGAGQALGGALANKIHSKENTPMSVGMDALSGMTAEVGGMAMGKYLSQQAAAWASRATLSGSEKMGMSILASRAEQRLADAKLSGVELNAAQASPETFGKSEAEVAREAVKASQQQQLQQSFDGLISQKEAAYASSEKPAKGGFYDVFDDIMGSKRNEIHDITTKAKEIAQDQTFPADPILSAIRARMSKVPGPKIEMFSPAGEVKQDVYNAYIKNAPDASASRVKSMMADYLKVQSSAKFNARNADPIEMGKPVGATTEDGMVAPKKAPGLHLSDVEGFVNDFSEKAKFNKDDRAASYADYGEIRHASNNYLMDSYEKAVGSEHPEMMDRLRSNKKFLSDFKETAQGFQEKLAYDPSNAAEALVTKNRPSQIAALKEMLTPEQFSYLGGGYLRSISKAAVDPLTGQMKAQTVSTAWNKVDPQIKGSLFGSDVPKIDALINRAKAMDAQGLKVSDRSAEGVVSAVKKLDTRGAMEFVLGIFKKNKNVQDRLVREAGDIVLPKGMSEDAVMKRKMVYQGLSAAINSVPGKAAVATPGALVGNALSGPSNDQPIPPRQ